MKDRKNNQKKNKRYYYKCLIKLRLLKKLKISVKTKKMMIKYKIYKKFNKIQNELVGFIKCQKEKANKLKLFLKQL